MPAWASDELGRIGAAEELQLASKRGLSGRPGDDLGCPRRRRRHPFGQTIHVSEGFGLCQRRGGPIEAIRPGDSVFFEPGEDHWHGAASDAS